MPEKTFIGLLIACSAGICGGLLLLLFTALLFSGYFESSPGDFFISSGDIAILMGCVLSFIGPFVFCIFFLLPLAAIENKKIETRSFKELITRYAPLISLPAGFLFCFPLFSDFKDENDRYAIMLIIITAFGICFSCFWAFIRKLKS
ncbi:MAG TPA: hypothetical protein VNZ49_08295 [Bacteroidia bacterium]|jgi:hypothetical protein|nr:hypothetical protein [Bacteroidia bacterium]